MITASNLKRGVVFRAEGHLYQVVSAEHHMGGGKMGGVEHLRLKDLESGGIVERRFRPEEKIEPIEVEKRRLEYLYQDGDFQVFMDLESYEQFPIPAEMIGDKDRYLGIRKHGQVAYCGFQETSSYRFSRCFACGEPQLAGMNPHP